LAVTDSGVLECPDDPVKILFHERLPGNAGHFSDTAETKKMSIKSANAQNRSPSFRRWVKTPKKQDVKVSFRS
jgi:hypothetical protein